MTIFKTLADLSAFMLMALMIYHVAVFLISFFFRVEPGKAARMHSFAVVISARNEREVLPHLIDSLRAQDYPRELYDIFIIADNCTDDTAAVSRERGAIVYQRDNPRKVGKGYALAWFFDRFLADYNGTYDAVAVFDADNLVDKGYLAAMNRRLCTGEVAVMGNRDSLNPGDNWVSGCSSMVFWTLSHMYFAPRMRCGLSSVASGTGFVFKTELVKDGWNTTTLSEDTEFSMGLVARGMRVAYESEALFFDEQPTDFRVSVRQRRRWGVGSYQNVPLTFHKFAESLPSARPGMMVDALLYILVVPLVVFNFVCLVLHGATMLLYPGALWPVLITSFLSIVIASSVSVFLQGLIALILARKLSLGNLKSLILYPFFLATTSFIYVTCLFTPKLKWHPIKRRRTS